MAALAKHTIQLATYVTPLIAERVALAARLNEESRSAYIHRLVMSDLHALGFVGDEFIERTQIAVPLFMKRGA